MRCPAASRTAALLTRSLAAGENERTVAAMVASAAMTLSVVPACSEPTVTTTGSNTSNCLVTRFCRASTISHAAGTGSAA